MSGLDVLNAIKADVRLASIPVVVLSTSHAEDDVVEAYRARGNCYVCKPIGLSRVIQDILHYFTTVALPPP
jgi:CheY-like chemotaxis protein